MKKKGVYLFVLSGRNPIPKYIEKGQIDFFEPSSPRPLGASYTSVDGEPKLIKMEFDCVMEVFFLSSFGEKWFLSMKQYRNISLH